MIFEILKYLYVVLIVYLAFIIMMFFTSCAAPREVIRTEYYATPSFCKVTMPTKPKLQDGRDYLTFISNLQDMLIYADELEMALLCCTGSNDCVTKQQQLLHIPQS